MAVRTYEWKGQSDKTYLYGIHEIDTIHKKVRGNYIFAKETKPPTWEAIYIGQTDDLSERFYNHHKMPCIRQNGATHIHTHESSPDESVRQAEENDLIQYNHPICND